MQPLDLLDGPVLKAQRLRADGGKLVLDSLESCGVPGPGVVVLEAFQLATALLRASIALSSPRRPSSWRSGQGFAALQKFAEPYCAAAAAAAEEEEEEEEEEGQGILVDGGSLDGEGNEEEDSATAAAEEICAAAVALHGEIEKLMADDDDEVDSGGAGSAQKRARVE